MLGLRQEEQGERGPPTWAKGSVLGPSRVPGLQDPAARCTLQKAASAVGCPLPHPGADTVGNPAPSSSSSPAPRPSGFVGLCGGLEGASALPQDRRCGLSPKRGSSSSCVHSTVQYIYCTSKCISTSTDILQYIYTVKVHTPSVEENIVLTLVKRWQGRFDSRDINMGFFSRGERLGSAPNTQKSEDL